MAAQMQMVMFMKIVSILGGVLLISQFGAGRSVWMLGARTERIPVAQRSGLL